MMVVGFDVAKDSLVATCVNKNGVIKDNYAIANTTEAIIELLMGLKARHNQLVVASEATGDYHRTLATACLKLGISFRLLNPLLVKQFVRTTVRKRKTDLTDAEAIAKVALQGHGYPVTASELNLAKPLLRTSIHLAEISQTCNLMEQRIANLAPTNTKLINELQNCQDYLKQAATVFRVHAETQADATALKLLTSIPGIGDNLAANLVIEIGDITKFKGPKQLIAFAGLDPKVLQSGKTLNRYGHLTKRGSATLRRALFIAASVARQHDPVCRALYDKKRAEGKRYKEATTVVSRKLARIVYAVWSNGKPYQIKHLT